MMNTGGIGLPMAAEIIWKGGITSLGELVGKILPMVYGVAGIALFGLIIYGGYMWMMSTGDPEKIRKATNTILNAAIGIAIIIFAYVATRIVGGMVDFPLLSPP